MCCSRHCEGRSPEAILFRGLPRRYAPRSDDDSQTPKNSGCNL
jgi:hypothetical protein